MEHGTRNTELKTQNIQQMKRKLVNKILELDDPELLTTLNKVIDLYEETNKASTPFTPPLDRGPVNTDITDLQGDIDEVFGK